jgi:hypothetical protein
MQRFAIPTQILYSLFFESSDEILYLVVNNHTEGIHVFQRGCGAVRVVPSIAGQKGVASVIISLLLSHGGPPLSSSCTICIRHNSPSNDHGVRYRKPFRVVIPSKKPVCSNPSGLYYFGSCPPSFAPMLASTSQTTIARQQMADPGANVPIPTTGRL